MSEFGLVIPTLNAGPWLDRLLPAIAAQTVAPSRFLVLDSESTDDTVERLTSVGAVVQTVPRGQFDHGGTRQLGVEALRDLPLLIFLTQDAIPADAHAFEQILSVFSDEKVALAYGRQLPRPGAAAIEAHARRYNYPEVGSIATRDDLTTAGIRAAFCSNSFSAYRTDVLMAMGGFPHNCIFGEDMIVALTMMEAGWSKAYVASAHVYHSHRYTISQEFRRNFDIGAMHQINGVSRLGKTNGEGFRFVKSELFYLIKQHPLLIPAALARTASKLTGYFIGSKYKFMPNSVRRNIGLNKNYWSRPNSA